MTKKKKIIFCLFLKRKKKNKIDLRMLERLNKLKVNMNWKIKAIKLRNKRDQINYLLTESRRGRKSGLVPHACNPSTQKVETEASLRVQGQFVLHGQF